MSLLDENSTDSDWLKKYLYREFEEDMYTRMEQAGSAMEKKRSLLFTPQRKTCCAVNSNGIQPMRSSPAAKGWMLGKPHSLALSRQQVPGVNSNIWLCIRGLFYGSFETIKVVRIV